MGSDDLFKKRKALEKRDFSRKVATKEQYTNILIICEGLKSEPIYFTDLIDDLGLSRTRIQIRKCHGANDPRNIVEDAHNTYQKNSDILDEVYCVFDQDGHSKFDEAVGLCEVHREKKLPIFPILSYPCFEYWILMHFTASTKPFKKSSDIVSDLKKKHRLKYTKDTVGLYEQIKDKTDIAIKNSKSTYKQAKASNNPNPSTQIYKLIERLRQVAQKEL